MKMKDMAENNETRALGVDRVAYYPSFRVTNKQLPQAKNWKIGETYKVCVEVKLVGMEEKSNRFEMRKIGCEK